MTNERRCAEGIRSRSTSVTSLATTIVIAMIAMSTTGCTYRPARFADRPLVTEVRDDTPIAMPRRNNFDEVVQISDVYLRRPLFDVFSPVRFPEAGDVNALDEVPSSTWFRVPSSIFEPTNETVLSGSAPESPLRVTGETPSISRDGIVVIDARGFRYELRRDSLDRPEMTTGAAAISSRLVRAFGLHSPGVWIRSLRRSDLVEPVDSKEVQEGTSAIDRFLAAGPASVDGYFRVSATRWPIGVDLGTTPDFDTRSDDPNDLVPHRDRRTLRGLKVLGAWLAMSPFGPRKTRDVYRGAAGDGHVVHYVVGLEDSLGTSSIVTPEMSRASRRNRPAGGFLFNLATLGLWPAKELPPTQRDHLAIGNFNEIVDPISYEPSPPYGPIVRVSPSDGYWAAKRLMAIPTQMIEAAVDAACFGDIWVRNELIRRLDRRRRTLAMYWYQQVTPCEVTSVREGVIHLRDQAVSDGISPAAGTHYRVEIVDSEGRPLTAPRELLLTSEQLSQPLPASLIGDHKYVVLRLTAERNGKLSPLACDVHVAIDEDGVARRVIGLQHGEGR